MQKTSAIILLSLFFVSCTNTNTALDVYLKAISAYKEKDFTNAEFYTNEALRIKKNFFQAEFLKGKIFFHKKDFENSKNVFLHLCSKKQNNFDLKLWLLKSYIFNQETDEAFILLNELIKTNNEDWRLWYWKAQLAKNVNDFETYFSCLTKAENILKDSALVFQELALIWHEFELSDKSALYYKKMEVISK